MITFHVLLSYKRVNIGAEQRQLDADIEVSTFPNKTSKRGELIDTLDIMPINEDSKSAMTSHTENLSFVLILEPFGPGP